MGIPQVPDRVRRVPALALRAVFAGLGRVLLAADRPLTRAGQVVARAAGDDWRSRQPAQQRPAPMAPPGSRWRSLDPTGNVRLLSDEHLDDADQADPEPVRTRIASRPAQPRPARSRATQSRVTLPLANYDDLSLASIRARLRGLDVSQLRILAEYESKHAERPEVLGMFERRIDKLQADE
jgi:hypothetical protein